MADTYRRQWNDEFKILQDTWPKPDNFEGCIGICLKLHAMVHSEIMSHSGEWSFEDELWNGLTDGMFRTTYEGDQSIAWKIWHCSRIEDITMNMLVAGDPQIFTTCGWPGKLGIKVPDTGNAMGEEEIRCLSISIDMQALREYRIDVGRKTRQIIRSLQPEDLREKAKPAGLLAAAAEGAVAEEAKWLLEYWGKKTKAGLLLMPATRHNLVHLNESIRLKGRRIHQA